MFAKTKTMVANGSTWEKEGGEVYSSWLRDPEGQLATWVSAPDEQALQGVSLRGSDEAQAPATFSVGEFARLCIILTQEDAVRRALIASGQDLTKNDLDSGVRRDDFWVTLVARTFNDEAYAERVARLPIYSSLLSTSHGISEERRGGERLPGVWPRSGEDLKIQFFRSRALFSECYRRWSVSGQNDPDAFTNFLPGSPGGTLSADGKKALILFRVLRCGESDEDTEVFNFTSKIAPRGVGVELGHKEAHDVDNLSGSAGDRRTNKKEGKRKTRGDEGKDDDILSVLREAVSVQRESLSVGSATDNEGYSTKRFRVGERRQAETTSLMKLVAQRRELRETGLDKEDPDILDFLNAEIESSKKRLSHFQNEEKNM